jgi:aminoglycoside phosphotransferase (APT) family kinase protein
MSRSAIVGDRLTTQLQDVVSTALGARVLIGGLVQLTAGASRQTWAFHATTPDGRGVPLILRRDPPGTAPRPISIEAHAMAAATAAGVPGPDVLAFADDQDDLDAPYVVMGRIDGHTLPRAILRDPALPGMNPSLAHQCGEALARIHAIPPAAVPGLATVDVLGEIADDLASLGEEIPVFEAALRWLHLHRPPAATPAIVHGDFRNGNLIVGPEGIRAVLDWELVHLGDPMRDLGYLCVRAWRFGAPGAVGGFGTYEQLLDGYEAVSGARPARSTVRWWEVFGALWWGVGAMRQARRHLSGEEPSLELAAIGRRAWEQEYDLLLLLLDEDGA